MKQLTPAFFLSLKSYTKDQFIKDVISGIIVAIIALPLSIALALASGVRPEQGLYTAIVAGFVISFFGGSTVQIAGPTAAFATIVAGVVAKNGLEGLVVATVLAGILLVVMGLLRMGSMIKFIPDPITVGFTAGIALTIVIGQIKDFMGLTFSHAPVETMEKVAETIRSMGTVNTAALAVGVGALAILIVTPKLLKRVPPSLVAVVVTAAAVELLDLPVNTIGDLYTISGALPAFHLPEISFGLVQAVLPDAITIAILAAIESLLSAVVADEMVDEHHNSNMELVAQGLGNMASALFGGIPATGAIARTAANINNGGRTPVAGMVHAMVLLMILVLLMPYAALIPMPTIAAILFVVAYNMSHMHKVIEIFKTAPKYDIAVLLLSFILTVVFDLVVAISVGLGLACLLFMKRMADVSDIREWDYVEITGDEEGRMKPVPAHVMVYEITGPMFFGSADKIPEISNRDGTKSVLILRMRAVPAVDSTAMNGFVRLVKQCRKAGVQVIFSHVNPQPMNAFVHFGLYEEIGEECFQPNIDAALAKAEAL